MKETRTLEFKRDISNTFLKTVSAYANYGSGRIVFGVDDDGKTVGIPDIENACLAIENKVNDSLSPVPVFTIDVNQRSQVITLAVEEGLHKPYLYKSKAYRRSDTSTVEVDRVELTRLVLEGENRSFESTRSNRESLNFTYLEEKCRDVLGIERLTPDILKTLELVDDDHFNVAGELLADANGFPGIDVVRFGDSINVMLDRETFDQMSILEQYDRTVSLFRKYYQYEVIEGAERELREDVPETAFREAVANALVHRQWDESSRIRVSMHPDRIEVASPGGLPHGLSEREYLEGQISKLRNPIIGNVFFRLHIIERFGTGVLRIKDAYRTSPRRPLFDVFENSIKITLPIVQGDPQLSTDEQAIYSTICTTAQPMSEITKRSGFGKTKAQKVLHQLIDDGLVEVTGSGRGTKYRSKRR